MKVLELVLTAAAALFVLVTPVKAAEYQGKNIDGKKLAAEAYYYATGGVYDVQVSFKDNRATIYFTCSGNSSRKGNPILCVNLCLRTSTRFGTL